MNKFTRQKFNELEKQQCNLYGVKTMSENFSVEPAQVQRIVAKVQQSDAFLNQINMITVDQLTGQALLLSADSMIAGRTNTNTTDRKTKSIHKMVNNDYLCQKTDFDTHITYAQLDAWAHKPNFKAIVSKQTLRSTALSMISIGWHGTSIAADTNPTTNPRGQDVNKGWLKHLKDRAPGNYLDSKNIEIGKDVANLDVAVLNCKNALGEIEQDDPDLVVILGSELLTFAEERLYALNAEKPSDKTKLELAQVIKTFGGMPAYKIPYFPKRGIMVTSFNNLSIYIHNSIRRRQEDNPKRDRVETFASKSLDYVIEDYEKIAYMASEKIKFPGE